MATGKSTLGQQLAEHLAWPFVDLDIAIEERLISTLGLSTNEVFENLGESVFRVFEKETVQDILNTAKSELVISLGGGTLHNTDLGEMLLNESSLYVLRAPWELVHHRIESSNRPLKDTARTLHRQRQDGYCVGHQIHIHGKSVLELVLEIIELHNEGT